MSVENVPAALIPPANRVGLGRSRPARGVVLLRKDYTARSCSRDFMQMNNA